jgi:hypothetical protein
MTANRFCRLSIRFGCLLLVAAACLISTSAQDSVYGDITIRIELPQTSQVGYGYGEFRALVANASPSQSHRVVIVLQISPYASGGQGVKEVRREVELAPNAKTSLSMFIPMLAPVYSVEVEIDGQRQREAAQVAYRAGVLDTGDRRFGLLLSPQILKSDLTSSSNFVERFRLSNGEKSVATQAPDMPIAEWSHNWLSYARYEGIVISGPELDAAPEAVRIALGRYVERGGALLVAGNWQAPPQWQTRQGFITNDEFNSGGGDKADAGNATAAASPPSVAAEPKPSSLSAETSLLSLPAQAKAATDLRVYFIGFGTVTVTGSVDPSQITVKQWAWMDNNVPESSVPVEDYYSITHLNQMFQVVEQFGVPVRGLFLLMLLFVIVIGPVNLFWLARRKRKIWLLWTVPAVSLMTCLMVAGFALFGEGWNATARTEALTILDETAHRATTIGWTGFYSPVTPSEGLHFSPDTELIPQIPEKYSNRRSAERTIDWTNDQHLSAGWVTARIPAFFKLRKSETRRERLTISPRDAGAATLVNGLGAEITQVWWADADGKIHSATNIPAGAQATLQATELKALAGASRLREAFSEDWLEQFKLFTEKPQEVLMANSYLAVLESSPFVEEGLKGVKTRKARNLVYGLSAGGR